MLIRNFGVASLFLAGVLGFLAHRRQFIGKSGYGFSTTAEEVALGVDLEGKVAIVTGATSGLGLETVRVLASSGARVFVCGRSVEKARKAIVSMKSQSRGELVPFACDLSSLSAVSACAHEFISLNSTLDLLVLNAGVAWLPNYSETVDGFETTMGVNHLSHFHLTNLLMPLLLSSVPSRVIAVSSHGYALGSTDSMGDTWLGMKSWQQRWWLGGAPAYGESKLANILHARELHNRYSGSGLATFSLTPGEIMTPILKPETGWLPWIIAVAGSWVEPVWCKSVGQGAATQIYCALKASVSGAYYDHCNICGLWDNYLNPVASLVNDRSKTALFWAVSERLVSDALGHASAS